MQLFWLLNQRNNERWPRSPPGKSAAYLFLLTSRLLSMSPNEPELLDLPLHRPGPHLKPLSSDFFADTRNPPGDVMLVDFCALLSSSKKHMGF